MFRLTATLVARTLARPWRTGWTLERGVDFSLNRPTRTPTAPPAARVEAAAAEPVCFIDSDDAVQVPGGLAGSDPVADGPPAATPETRRLQGWWTLSGKPSRT